ncbi:MAG: helix-turn-helix domain-containing protein, partial [Oscillospiraceae bacterium]|nr:helix-turn-helix domain-containing protein [Oscillospiraceae bacterium]
MQEKLVTFGDRLRQIRKEQGLSLEELGKVLGTSKQVLSRYETNQRAPKVSVAAEYAKKLNVSLDYMMGDAKEENSFLELGSKAKKKLFYKIFIDVTAEMGLDIPGIVRVTGLTDSQVRSIIFKRMKDAPLPLALLLSDKLDVPLETWTGEKAYVPAEISVEARAVALAFDRADEKSRGIVRVVLG